MSRIIEKCVKCGGLDYPGCCSCAEHNACCEVYTGSTESMSESKYTWREQAEGLIAMGASMVSTDLLISALAEIDRLKNKDP